MKKIADHLNMQYVYSRGYQPAYGNALFYRFKEKYSINTKKLFLNDEEKDLRSAAGIEIDDLGLTVYTTHLDHRFESLRLKQLDVLKSSIGNTPSIVCGDFNSLCFEDYTAPLMKEITDDRIRSNWEIPYPDVYNSMAKDYIDTWRSQNDNLDPATCVFDTRIDFIWVHNTVKCNIKRSKITEALYFTDHNGIETVVTL